MSNERALPRPSRDGDATDDRSGDSQAAPLCDGSRCSRPEDERNIEAFRELVARRWGGRPPFARMPTEELDRRLSLITAEPEAAPGVEIEFEAFREAIRSLRTSGSGAPARWSANADRLAESLRPAAAVIDAAFELVTGMVRRFAGSAADPDLEPDPAGIAESFMASLGQEMEKLSRERFLGIVDGSGNRPGTDHATALGVIENHVARQLAGFDLLLRRLDGDLARLRDLTGRRHLVLSGVELAGDLHENGAVTILEFSGPDGSARVVYKPHGLQLDVALAGLLERLDAALPGTFPRVPITLARGSYGWQIHVSWRESDSAAQVREYYRRMGGLLALSFLLRVNDLHYENVVCDGTVPILVDPECMFGTAFEATSEDPDGQLETPVRTVLQTGLLPNLRRSKDGRPFDISALGAVGPRHRPVSRVFVEANAPVDPADDLTTDLWHLPALAGKTISVAAHPEDLIAGFTSAYDLFVRERETLSAADGPLAAFDECRTRLLLKPTWAYGTVVRRLIRESPRCALHREEILNALWSTRGSAFGPTAEIFRYERLAALHGYVPTFAHLVRGHDLLMADRALTGIFSVTGRDLVRARVLGLSERDKDVQVRLIRASLATLPREGEDVPRTGGNAAGAQPRTDSNLTDDHLTAAAAAIGALLGRSTLRTGNRSWWLSSRPVDPESRSLHQALPGLYDGTAGIALFTGYLHLLTGGAEETSRTAVRAMQDEAELLIGRNTLEDLDRYGALGVYEGLWGSVYAAACLGLGRGDERLLAWSAELCRALTPGIRRTSHWDLINGTSGVALVATRLALALGDDAFARAAEQAFSATEQQLTEVFENETVQAGMAHGLSGPALAFSWGSLLFEGQGYEKACEVVLSAERSQCYWDERGWHDALGGPSDSWQATKTEGWCRGAGGIGLARLAIPATLHDGLFADEIALARSVLEHRPVATGDLGLCHGETGTLEFLLAGAGDAGRAEAIRRRHGAMATEVLTSRRVVQELSTVPNPGLLPGFAGVGYALLRAAFPGRLPNVLTLEVPQAGSNGERS
ncbi:type 2 lanthipeptide synthetase LanM family protein [Kitasatospora viridis]|uniref:Type 2 lantibiotic biosynthesis protein LanM n=1 Tax=Kitasatospora viridis TaxID=281105 RepID=A0A561TWB3_9ACTN|nr:type 2 lanthipeptide synthetase LanM family protein [Kitasatospora viridis]TWF91400.1 type 2 lantibiotic biosynthesis protein LanM [Kitasatospora viridis]